MTSSSPQYAGISLTDELAEATNDLLNLGGRELGKSHDSTDLPLLTPSPLNLSTGVAGAATLSSLLAVGQNSRLVLIHDDDEQESSTKATYSGINRQASGLKELGAASFDDDNELSTSQLKQKTTPASASPRNDKDSNTMPRLRSRSEEEAHLKNRTRNGTLHSLDDEMSPRAAHTPTFFTESFPEAQAGTPVISENGNDARNDKICAPVSLQHAVSVPAPPTLSSIDEASITVKLHGNRRLEREAEDRLKVEQNDGILPSEEVRIPAVQADDGDRSSLLSLAATAMTSSSQASSKARRRLVRRRSGGSTSVVNEDLDTAEDMPFARDVQIRGFTVVGEKVRGFVCYDVRVITIRGTTISILRRFSSFCQLRQSLTSERPQHASLVPPLPPRRTGLFQKYASHHLEKRRRALQKWLAVVMLDRRWATTKSLREWVVGSSEEM